MSSKAKKPELGTARQAAKADHFGKNKLGYFVKWKGYSDEHNSWVSEQDAQSMDPILLVRKD
ncbi:hypothetical protein B0H11DRAFT_2229952 [Mycena galericulata]|nr:hypothetical protein B0H11DRAFT_2229952 [Mycena galericulata]